ncbi:hypothetical protein I302_101107 [Kwoniella bestiolae CBS 10118]|uniref:Protein CPL1-like domain-containing protein n=1 Tax=Kwoniella bestiolae CBS 10118 TaxID=1296100 RepID=A0A1B9G6Z9_9TREE|nr:hypothetical protein I302_04482 [Kwoniella bestiolae CBS 10118]OCF26792.1 hypothetical protein I302_04482 [Kwoniella bestiolae CBS 10118]
MFTLLAPAALVALASLNKVRAVYPSLYAGCSQFYPDNSVLIDQQTYGTEDCASLCYVADTGPYLYSYFQAGADVRKRQATSTCRCSNEIVPATFYVESTDNAGSCQSYNWAIAITASTYEFDGCFTAIGTQDGAPAGVYTAPDQASPEDCLQVCASYEVAAFTPGTGPEENAYSCTCGPMSAFTNTGQNTCGYGDYFVYDHKAGRSVSSDFAKRQMKETLVRARNGKKRALCPAGLTACKVSQYESDSFECIDTTSELESCGGCAHGEFNNPAGPLGVDCSALPGLARGGVTCNAGQCQAFACQRGWTLTPEETCVQA